MEPSIYRLFLVFALVFFIACDFSSVFSPLMTGFDSDSNSNVKKVDPVKTSRSSQDGSSIEEEEKKALRAIATAAARNTLMATLRNSCLPKVICELNATPHRERLSEAEKSLLNLIRDTSISMTAEVPSKYHFAAHMGQLIAGVDGTGCHNFYPSCPFPGMQILQIMKKVKIR